MPRSNPNSKNPHFRRATRVPRSPMHRPRAQLTSTAFHESRVPNHDSRLPAVAVITAHNSRISAFRFATHRKTGIDATLSKQTIALFPVRNKSRDFGLSNFCGFRHEISAMVAPPKTLFPASPRPSRLKISLPSPTQLQDTCANVFPHFGRRDPQ